MLAGTTIYILAGPNGAGKTTFANSFLQSFANCREFLNADLIAAGLSPFAPESQAVRASKLLLKRIDELLADWLISLICTFRLSTQPAFLTVHPSRQIQSLRLTVKRNGS
jgi:predicted ABC-type ATPase